MRRTMCLVLLFMLACGEEPSGGTDAAVTDSGGVDSGAASDGGASDSASSDGAATDTAVGGAGTWWTCSTWESLTGTKTPRDVGCESANDADLGCKAPWFGVKQGGTTYTCNRCRGGDPVVQARWRAIDFATEDPSKPLSGGHKEVIVVDGNTWHLRAEHTDKQGKLHEVKVSGWYWCSDGAELKSEKNVFHTTHVEGSDFFGWIAPDVFTGLFLTKGANLFAWSYDQGFETKKVGDAIYCRIGSTVNGKPCTDPFE